MNNFFYLHEEERYEDNTHGNCDEHTEEDSGTDGVAAG